MRNIFCTLWVQNCFLKQLSNFSHADWSKAMFDKLYSETMRKVVVKKKKSTSKHILKLSARLSYESSTIDVVHFCFNALK